MKISARVTTFSKSGKREIFKVIESPGPGRYKEPSINDTTSHKFSKSEKLKFEDKNTPGVGNYEKSISAKSPKYTFNQTKRPDTIPVNNTHINLKNVASLPGPGRYNPVENSLAIKKKTPSYTIGGKFKDSNQNFTPGPGQYDFAKDSPILNYKGAGTISKSKRELKFAANHTSINLTSNTIETTPGPGRYNSHSSLNDSKGAKAFKLAHSERVLTRPDNTNPGPGSYLGDGNTTRFNEKAGKGGYSVSKASKKDYFTKIAEAEATKPGPGRYNNMKQEKLKGFIFTGKDDKIDVQKTPGPGEYDSNLGTVKARPSGWKLPQSPKLKDVFNISSSSSIPGPGRYNNKSAADSNAKESGFVFGKDAKMKFKDTGTPGPGSYRIPCLVRDVTDYNAKGGSFDPNFKYV